MDDVIEAHTSDHSAMPGYADSKDSQLRRLKRIEGQIRGLQRMIGEDTYCIDVLTQVSAATKALESFSLGLLHEHLQHCVADAIRMGGDDAKEKVDEATAAIGRLLR
jgi:DNA-binding FrmR family transcriptional regulator